MSPTCHEEIWRVGGRVGRGRYEADLFERSRACRTRGIWRTTRQTLLFVASWTGKSRQARATSS